MLKIQLYITGINYILKYIQIENRYFKLNKYFTIVLFYLLDQINEALVSSRDLFKKKILFF